MVDTARLPNLRLGFYALLTCSSLFLAAATLALLGYQLVKTSGYNKPVVRLPSSSSTFRADLFLLPDSLPSSPAGSSPSSTASSSPSSNLAPLPHLDASSFSLFKSKSSPYAFSDSSPSPASRGYTRRLLVFCRAAKGTSRVRCCKLVLRWDGCAFTFFFPPRDESDLFSP
jgi:hypothetical protein